MKEMAYWQELLNQGFYWIEVVEQKVQIGQ